VDRHVAAGRRVQRSVCQASWQLGGSGVEFELGAREGLGVGSLGGLEASW
jgi:hypothetical protein